jgi:hypothetical protein
VPPVHHSLSSLTLVHCRGSPLLSEVPLHSSLVRSLWFHLFIVVLFIHCGSIRRRWSPSFIHCPIYVLWGSSLRLLWRPSLICHGGPPLICCGGPPLIRCGGPPLICCGGPPLIHCGGPPFVHRGLSPSFIRWWWPPSFVVVVPPCSFVVVPLVHRVWCAISTRDPPCEQWLTSMGVGAGLLFSLLCPAL